MSTKRATPPEKNTIWKTIRKISLKIQLTTLKHPTKYKTEATTKKDVADTLAKTFSAISSLHNSNRQFLTFNTKAEKHNFNFKSHNTEKYSKPFTPAELKETIQKSHKTTVGPGEIHYEFLKHLPKNLWTTFWRYSMISR